MSKLPVPTAKEINDAHASAKSCAGTAVEHAIQCGRMLARKKDDLGRGKFDEWVATYCKFDRAMAYNYMKAAKSSNALDGFTSLRQALGYESHKPAAKSLPKSDGKYADPMQASVAKEPVATKPESAPEVSTDPERPEWDADEDAALERAQAELAVSTERIMSADDKLAAAYAEIKRQAAEIATLKVSRDGYMNGKAEVVELLKKEQRKVARLEKELARLRSGTGIAA